MTIARSGAADFDITTIWQLDARPEELTEIVLDPECIHLWCPSVFLDSKLVARGRADGLGMAIRIYSKGFLPHSFFCVAEVVNLVRHRYMKIAVAGDFEGVGELFVAPNDAGGCDATLHWTTNVRHRYVSRLVRFIHPVFVWNHKWAMRYARRLLQAEVYRRRNALNGFSPARATFPHNLAIYRAWQRRRAEYRGLY